MDRRESTRSKRRIPCEFQHQGHRYRGIATSLSPSGLFIQTNATLDRGVDLEVVFLEDRVPGFSVRGRVVRRRAPPAALASVIHAGLGLRIVEAPDAFFEFLRMKPTKAKPPGREPARAPATALPEPGARGSEVSRGAATVAPVPAAREEAPAPARPGRHGALLIDDGELEDVFAMLEALDADPVRFQPGADEDFGKWENPPRAVVVSANAAARLVVGFRAGESGMVTIAVADTDSQTLCKMLHRQGFDYVVRRPVHPEALRLLLMRALYRGSERRSQPRLPFGCDVIGRWGIRRRPITLLEISGGGCRFLGPEALKPGTRVWLRIPSRRAAERPLTLRGRVRRTQRKQEAAPEASTEVALAFDPLSKRIQERLEILLAECLTGPPALPRSSTPGPVDAGQPTTTAGAGQPARKGRRTLRRLRRVAVERKLIVLDGPRKRARQVLLARDLSVGGARVDPHPDLRVGDRFKLALYGHASPGSIVVDAEVLRDEGARGLALRFLNAPASATREIERILEGAGEIERSGATGDAQPLTVAEMVAEERA